MNRLFLFSSFFCCFRFCIFLSFSMLCLLSCSSRLFSRSSTWMTSSSIPSRSRSSTSDHLRQGHACQASKRLQFFTRTRNDSGTPVWNWFSFCNSFISFQTSVNIVRLVSQDFFEARLKHHSFMPKPPSHQTSTKLSFTSKWLLKFKEYGPTERIYHQIRGSLIMHMTPTDTRLSNGSPVRPS